MRLTIVILLLVCSSSVFGQNNNTDEIRRSIYFGGGSYYISDEQVVSLNHWLDSIPDLLEKYEIHLISHTDPIGGREYNAWLSKMRSGAVHGILIERAIPEHKITIKDWGLDNAVYRNDTFQGMKLNRRVDVILYPIVF